MRKSLVLTAAVAVLLSACGQSADESATKVSESAAPTAQVSAPDTAASLENIVKQEVTSEEASSVNAEMPTSTDTTAVDGQVVEPVIAE